MSAHDNFNAWHGSLSEHDQQVLAEFSKHVTAISNEAKAIKLKHEKLEALPDKEYHCYLLDPTAKMSHIEGTKMLATDHLHEACSFVHDLFVKYGIEACVYQPRHQCYREHYRREE